MSPDTAPSMACHKMYPMVEQLHLHLHNPMLRIARNARGCTCHLDLLSTPAGIRLAHVRGGFDRGDELEGGVRDTDEADNGAADDLPDRAGVENNDADEDVD